MSARFKVADVIIMNTIYDDPDRLQRGMNREEEV